MPRSLSLTAVFALSLVFYGAGAAQDSPSLGDLAKQAQKNKEKDKANKPAAKVITNDDVPSGSAGGGSALGGGLGQIAQSASAGGPGAVAPPAEKLERLKLVLDQLDSTDRATLVRGVLEGNDSNFPGRARWEERLFSAKQTYVSQGRTLLQRMKQLMASTEGMKDIRDQNDPRLKNITEKLQQLVQDATQTGAAFQAVMMEGKDLAGQSAGH